MYSSNFRITLYRTFLLLVTSVIILGVFLFTPTGQALAVDESQKSTYAVTIPSSVSSLYSLNIVTSLQNILKGMQELLSSVPKKSQLGQVVANDSALVAAYNFDEGSGTVAGDKIGNNNGTLAGPSWTSGKSGSALSFDGVDDYVNIGAFDVQGSALTLSAWIKADNFNIDDARIISKTVGTGEQDHVWMLSTIDSGGTKLRFRLKTGGITHTLIGTTAITAGVWTHVSATYDGSTMRLYVNGVESGTMAKSGSITSASSVEAWIGRNPGGYGTFDGVIDDVRIYSRAFSAGDIQNIMSGDTTPAPSDTSAPTSPTNLSASAISSSQINLTWTASTDATGVTGYRVERCTGASCTSYSQVGTPTSNSYSDTGLTAATTYRYRVRAVDAAGNLSGYSSVVSGVSEAAAVVVAGCDLNATTANFSAQVTAASSGQTICLATGSYGTWTGTNKAITIKAANGASPTMNISFGTGDSGFTLEGMKGMGGVISGSASNITIKNSEFTGQVSIAGTGTGIVFDGNTHNNISGAATSQRFLVEGPVTIKNSRFEGGGSDGVRFGSSAPASVINNTFINILDDGSGNHTDMIQWYGGSNATVKGNLFKQTIAGETQVMGAFDGTEGNIIEDNVIDVTGRNWGIELYSDDGSIVRHNTVVYRPSSVCPYNTNCGSIALDRKSANSAGINTQIYDNIATDISIGNGSTASRRNYNMLRQYAGTGEFIGIPVFVGGSNPSTYDGYALAAGSPGKNAASDGLDVGARIGNVTVPVSDTTAPTSPTNLSASAISSSQINLTWTASTDATGVTGYRVERCTGASCTSYSQVGTPTSNSYSDTGLTAATTYRYRVRAVDAAGNLSGYSSVVSGVSASDVIPPTGTTANVWVDTNGGSCARQSTAGSYGDTSACANIQSALAACVPGDIIRMKAGTYESQIISAVKTSPGCTVIAEDNTKIDSLTTNGAWYEIQNISGSGWDISNAGTNNITCRDCNFSGNDGVWWTADGYSNIKWIGGSLRNFSCSSCANGMAVFGSNSAGGVTSATNLLIDGVTFDNIRNTGGNNNHFEVIRIDGKVNGLTVRNSTFTNNETSTSIIFFTTFRGTKPQNITFENNFFGSPGSAYFVFQMNFQNLSNCSDLTFRYNTFAQGAGIFVDPASGSCNGGFSNIVWVGNLGPTGNCRGTDFRSNVWYGSSGTACGSTDSVTTDSGLGGSDGFHLTASSYAIDRGGSGNDCISTDHDGNNRPAGVRCDAGAIEFNGTPAPTVPVSDLTPPTLSSISASNITTSGANITWTTNEVADTQVEYGQTTSYGQSTTLNSSLVTNHTQALSGLSANTTYHYRVKSKDAAGNTALSLNQTFTTNVAPDTQAPGAISSLSAGTPNETSVTLSFIAPTDLPNNGAATSYDLRYLQGVISSSNWSGAIQVTGEPTPGTPGLSQNYTLAGLNPSTLYTVAIRSSDAAGNISSISNIVTITTKATPTASDLTPPTLSSISASNITTSGANITWTTNEVADTQVEYGQTTSYGQSTTLNSSLVTNHTQALSGLSANTTYHYRVKSKDAAGNITVSGDQTFSTPTAPDTTAPTIPANVIANPLSTTQINLTWTPSTDVVGVVSYRIERCAGASCNNFTQVGTSAGPSYSNSGLVNSTLYRYRVRAVDTAGNISAYSSIVSATTLSVIVVDTTAPTLTNITVTDISTTSAIIVWNTNESSDTVVRYGTNASALTSTISDSGLVANHTIKLATLNRRTTYYYQVTSRDVAGNSVSSTIRSFKTGSGKPAKISGVQAKSGSIILTWDSTSVDPYAKTIEVYRNTKDYPIYADAKATKSTLTDIKNATFTDTTALDNTPYYYSLFVVDDEGEVSESAQVSYTRSTPKPNTGSSGGGGGGGGTSVSVIKSPTTGFILGAPNQIIVRWKNPKDSSFVRTRVIRKEGKAPTSISDGTVVYEGSGEEFIDTSNLKKNIEYHYAIFALDQSLKPSSFLKLKAKLNEKTIAESHATLGQITTTKTTAPTPVSLPITNPFGKNLYLGLKDAEVVRLQEFLTKTGDLSPDNISGLFGPLTQTALKKFQCREGIACSGTPDTNGYGSFGPKTRAIVNSKLVTTVSSSATYTPDNSSNTYIFTKVLGLGSKGEDVTELQKRLIALGYLNETPTGYYGSLTEQAVKRFQIAKGIEPVGSLGPQSRMLLNQTATSATNGTTNLNQLLQLVQQLQQQLEALKKAGR